jgi:hypothetical protein
MRLRAPRPLLALFPILSFWAPGAARAQSVLVDEGTFNLTLAGRAAGTETFSIRQTGSGPSTVVIARGTTTVDTSGVSETLTTSLQAAGTALTPTAYDVVIRGPTPERITGRIVGGRFSAKITTATGEELREYLASNQAVLVDQGVAYQYYFLARRLEGDSMRVPVIVPRESRQVTVTVALRGEEPLSIGGQQITARRLVVTAPGEPERILWVDARGRVLRLDTPARDFSARRSAPPPP